MKKLLFTSLVLLLSLTAAQAQRHYDAKARISGRDSITRAQLVIVEHGRAAEVVKQINDQTTGGKIKGYRVRIFFDNGQNARSGAAAVLSQFRELYPDIPAKMVYENPYFKVTVGNCLSQEEAVILWGRVKNQFDKAFVTTELIDINSLGLEPSKSASQPVEEQENQ